MKSKIGLEIHGYLKTKQNEKLFSEEKIMLDAEPNTTISPITTGLPGSKPMAPNSEAVEKVFAIAGLLDCKLTNILTFYRKHYEWPDMPTGYQRTISGPYAQHPGEKGSFLGIGITEVHLEEDPARWDAEKGTIDYNRSGYALVEIVTDPDFTEAEEVREWLKKLMTALSYIDAIDMKLGVKADVNISIEPDFQRVEIKNVHSFKGIVDSINSEIKRQEKEVKQGKKILQETRFWNEQEARTVFMRKKEDAVDYCFLPEPDLLSIYFSEEQLQKLKTALPEKPEEKQKKYVAQGITENDAYVLSSDFSLADFYEKVSRVVNPIISAKWIRRELTRVLHYQKKELQDTPLKPEQMIELLSLVERKEITDAVGQKLLEKLVEESFDIQEYIKKAGLKTQQDEGLLQKYCKEAIQEHAKAVEDFNKGEEKALHFLMGQVMRKTKGTALPENILDMLKKLLK